jgi:bifunctional damage-control phosphatase, subfamily II, fusion protein
LNREEKRLAAFSLLVESTNYVPDLIDLTQDEEARKYWLDCFEKTINTVKK